MTPVCANGHASQADDFCDTCGARIDPQQPAGGPFEPAAGAPAPAAGAPAPAAGAPAPGGVEPASSTGQTCPHCDTVNPADALFCEACGYDFTTGALPRAAAPATRLEWVAEVWVDPQWYAGQDAEEPLPSPGLPDVVPLKERSLLIGRVSVSRNIAPDIDAAADTGVSRRHAQLTSDGRRWFIEDLGSANGTFVGPASGPLPQEPIPVGSRTELDADDRIYIGAWTRVVIRQATEEERAAADD